MLKYRKASFPKSVSTTFVAHCCLMKMENVLSFQEFQRSYDFRTNFLNFYQVINAIPKALVIKAFTQDKPLKENYLGNRNSKLQLAENIVIDLQKTKAKDFYWLLNEKINNSFPTGAKK